MKISLDQIGKWLSCREHYHGFASGFRQDSRLVQKGDLFFALSGEKVDGHLYLKEVALKGAIGAVVLSSYQGDDFGLQLFRVPDVLSALHSLARQIHILYPCRIIAVTGSVGKTTTKEFIATLLEGSFRTNKTPGNANSQVGMPLTLLNAKGNEEVFVIEMGMSQPQEIAKLVSIAPPEIAVVTKIALCHVASFSNGLEGIAAAKAEIFSSAYTDYAVLNAELLSFPSFSALSCSRLSYGLAPVKSDFTLHVEADHYFIQEKELKSPLFTLPFAATHLLENFTAAAFVARLMGVSWEEIFLRSAHLHPVSKRFELIEREGITFINDAYNANPTSMRAALHNLPAIQNRSKRIAVLGAMKELGPFEEESHRQVAFDALSVIDHLLCLGKECAPMEDVFALQGKPVELFLEFQLLKERVFELAKKGDVVLLKGSNSNQLWRILE